MALTLVNALKSTLADAITTAIGAAGYMELQTAGDVEVATLPFNNPAFNAAANGVIAVNNTPQVEDTNATGNGGAVTKFKIYASGAVLQLDGVVATSGQDLDISSTIIGATDTVQLTSFSITVP